MRIVEHVTEHMVSPFSGKVRRSFFRPWRLKIVLSKSSLDQKCQLKAIDIPRQLAKKLRTGQMIAGSFLYSPGSKRNVSITRVVAIADPFAF